MFILRTVTGGNKQINEKIGETYAFTGRDFCYEEFCRIFEQFFGKNHVADLDDTADEITKSCYGFIEANGIQYPLYKNHDYYIMTESGKTFNNLTYLKN